MEERTLDSLLVALAHPWRRGVCSHLADTNEPTVTVRELASAVDPDVRTGPTPPATGTGGDTNALATLHHVHLPRLDDVAVIEYDSGEGSVRTDVAFPAAVELLGGIEELGSIPERDSDRQLGR